MVATRRGVRVCSPNKSNQESSSEVQATPCTSRRTRSTVKKAENLTQHGLSDNFSQLEKVETEHPVSASSSSVKRCTRASRLHSPEQPCTPVGSSHEADISDVESCCSALSDITKDRPRTGNRGRIRKSRVSPEDEDISEVESCSSAVSPSRSCQVSRSSTRRRKIHNGSDSPLAAKVELALEADLSNTVPSESQRVTRSQRRTARTRSSAKQQTDSELSDTDSQVSSVSKSTSRRSTRSRTQTSPIPIHLDEATESSLSPFPTRRSSRTARGKKSVTVDVSESQSCDSEEFESAPTHGRRNLRWGKATKSIDSDSDLSNVHSPLGNSCSTRSRGTPCSSRSGSGNSKHGILSFGQSTKHLTIVLEKTEGPAKEGPSLNDSRLESTIIAEDADCTLLEENVSQSLEEKENYSVSITDSTTNEMDTVKLEKGVRVISEEDSHVSDRSLLDSSGCAQEPVSTPAVSVRDQQEELCDENKDGDTSEMEVMQETIYSSEPINSCQSVALKSSERTSEATGESGEMEKSTKDTDVDTHPPQRDGGAAVKTCPSEEEKMEVSTLDSDEEDQQVVNSGEVQVETIEIKSSQQRKITVDSLPEEQHENVIVKNKNVISLLESSEDEDEEKQISEEEDLGCMAEDKRGHSEAAGTSGGGLFVIDTRPGQDADEDYYLAKATEETVIASKEETEGQEEEDEEFVDEEGDDEDANLLFLCRNPLLKEMSSRIDPGIKMKELGGLYINFDGSKSKPVSSLLKKIKEKKIQDEVMKKSVIVPDFEKKDVVPPYNESKQATKLKKRVEREKSTGDGWFNMKAPEITQELKGDLQVLKMRGSLDPKRFYKKNDRDGFPKYFQVGTVVDNPVDFYHSRVPKKERKRNMVEELLADAEFRHKNKRKFQQIVAEKAAQTAGKKNKKKNKFNKK